MIVICAKLFLNHTMHNKVMGRSRTGFTEVYPQSSSADCDLDLKSSDMVLVCDTLSCHDNYLCQIIFKSHYVRLSYGPDTFLEHTHTHTDRVNSICSSAILWRGHNKISSNQFFLKVAATDQSSKSLLYCLKLTPIALSAPAQEAE